MIPSATNSASLKLKKAPCPVKSSDSTASSRVMGLMVGVGDKEGRAYQYPVGLPCRAKMAGGGGGETGFGLVVLAALKTLEGSGQRVKGVRGMRWAVSRMARGRNPRRSTATDRRG